MQIDFEKLSPQAKDISKAIDSLREELEAVNFYNMRAEQTEDNELKQILIHNRNEEIEHAAMLTEWLCRTIPNFNFEFKEYLFSKGSITNKEAQNLEVIDENSSLGIGSLK